MITEIRIYKLKENTAGEFNKVFTEQSLPMLKRWNVDVVDYGFSLIDKESFYLIRNYENLEHRKESQDAFYGSDEWINGPEKMIMKCIDTYNTTIVDATTFPNLNRLRLERIIATMSEITIKPIGFVKNNRIEPFDDHWSSVESIIELTEDLPDECFDGIEQFSHLEIIYHFNKSTKTLTGSGHPRENQEYPKVGIFVQRKKDRPNHIGATIVNLISRNGRKLIVKNLDAINGTPIIDIKPVYSEYLPQGEVKQPKWTNDLMTNYW